MSKFRSVEFWKSSIMTLPDNAFFDLLRTIFGKIKTPFSKQVLMNDLEKFLSRDDIRKNIFNYINNDDRLVIAAVAALNEPTQGEIEAFFAGELSYSNLHDLVVNLEERFILYRFFDNVQNKRLSRLALNPVLESVLAPIADDSSAADGSLLFPSVAVDKLKDETPSEKPFVIIDDRILAALLSFVSRNKLFFRTGGGIRQKAGNAAKKLFPRLPLETVINGLCALGLFITEGETMVADYRCFTAFGELSRRERMAYCAASMLLQGDDDISPWLTRTKIYNYAELINSLYNLIEKDRLYKRTTLNRLTHICKTEKDVNNSDKIIDVMEKTCMIAGDGDKWRKVELAESTPPVSIVMDTQNTLFVYPEIAYNEVIAIAGFTDLVEAGMTVRFEINRDSVVQAFNGGLSADAIIELLQRLSNNRINENVLFTLRDWEKRHGEVTLRRALVLTLSEQQRHLAETKPLAKLIIETLAPGIYLLPESAEESASHALSKAGVSIIGRRGGSRGEELSGGSQRQFFQPLSDAQLPAGSPVPPVCADASAASILIDQFHSILEQMQLSGEARDELAARIDRRMVLSETQLKDANVRYEKLEARGMDYVGKSVIAKQAIAMQSPVELVLPGKQKQDHVFGIPKALEKAGSESVLVVELLEGDTDDNIIRVPLGKISLLRRIKKSIFEG